MVSINLDAVGKRYKTEWIFKNISLQLNAGLHYAVEGRNGAGKSTFLQLLSGHLSPSHGSLHTQYQNQIVEREQLYSLAAIAAPYAALIEDFTLLEAIDFQQHFKKWAPNVNSQTVADTLAFTKNNRHKALKYFSSGMRQRVKLALAILSDAPLLLLDEPTITLDKQGTQWFYDLLAMPRNPRTVIIASNVEADFQTCTQRIDLLHYK